MGLCSDMVQLTYIFTWQFWNAWCLYTEANVYWLYTPVQPSEASAPSLMLTGSAELSPHPRGQRAVCSAVLQAGGAICSQPAGHVLDASSCSRGWRGGGMSVIRLSRTPSESSRGSVRDVSWERTTEVSSKCLQDAPWFEVGCISTLLGF